MSDERLGEVIIKWVDTRAPGLRLSTVLGEVACNRHGPQTSIDGLCRECRRLVNSE